MWKIKKIVKFLQTTIIIKKTFAPITVEGSSSFVFGWFYQEPDDQDWAWVFARR